MVERGGGGGGLYRKVGHILPKVRLNAASAVVFADSVETAGAKEEFKSRSELVRWAEFVVVWVGVNCIRLGLGKVWVKSWTGIKPIKEAAWSRKGVAVRSIRDAVGRIRTASVEAPADVVTAVVGAPVLLRTAVLVLGSLRAGLGPVLRTVVVMGSVRAGLGPVLVPNR